MMLQLLKHPTTGQYVQYCTGWYRGCYGGAIPGDHIFFNMYVHKRHSQGIWRIEDVPFTSLGYNRK